jgi:hypothetical protein
VIGVICKGGEERVYVGTRRNTNTKPAPRVYWVDNKYLCKTVPTRNIQAILNYNLFLTWKPQKFTLLANFIPRQIFDTTIEGNTLDYIFAIKIYTLFLDNVIAATAILTKLCKGKF